MKLMSIRMLLAVMLCASVATAGSIRNESTDASTLDGLDSTAFATNGGSYGFGTVTIYDLVVDHWMTFNGYLLTYSTNFFYGPCMVYAQPYTNNVFLELYPTLTNLQNQSTSVVALARLSGIGTQQMDAATAAKIDGALTNLTAAAISAAGGVTNRVPVPLTYTSTNIYTDASLANTFRVTLTNNATLQLPTGATDGQTIKWWITQGVGSNTLDIATTIVYPTGTTNLALSTTIGSKDLLIGEYDGSTTNLHLTGLLLFAQ